MSGIGGLVSLVELGAIPLVALPVNAVLGQILVKTLPPNGVVVKVQSNVGEYSVLLGALKSIEVRMCIGARCHAEESVFRIYSVKASVCAYSHP